MSRFATLLFWCVILGITSCALDTVGTVVVCAVMVLMRLYDIEQLIKEKHK